MEESNALKQLEALEVIESSDLAIGHAFHAFKFQVSVPPAEPQGSRHDVDHKLLFLCAIMGSAQHASNCIAGRCGGYCSVWSSPIPDCDVSRRGVRA